MQISVIAFAAGLALAASSFAFGGGQDDAVPITEEAEPMRSQPIEIGTVDWLRDLEAAKAESARTNKPILALFQEVPG